MCVSACIHVEIIANQYIHSVTAPRFPLRPSAGEITGENVWFTDSLKQFNAAATKLPFDHHMLHGMMAPRGLLIIENTGQVSNACRREVVFFFTF